MKGTLPPLILLASILAFSLWNSKTMAADTARWQAQLRQADALAQSEDWEGAAAALSAGYQDWSARQTYLHIVSPHNAVDEADTMYRRCLAFASTQELAELLAETAGLTERLRLLTEMEQLSIRNIL